MLYKLLRVRYEGNPPKSWDANPLEAIADEMLEFPSEIQRFIDASDNQELYSKRLANEAAKVHNEQEIADSTGFWMTVIGEHDCPIPGTRICFNNISSLN